MLICRPLKKLINYAMILVLDKKYDPFKGDGMLKLISKLVLFPMLVVTTIYTQTWKDDSLVVRQILDTNGLQAVPVDSVVDFIFEGRVNQLRFRNLLELKTILSSIEKLDKLDQLSFNRTGLTSVPPEIGNLKSLGGLYFSYNKISSLPPEIKNLKILNHLVVGGDTAFTSVPSEIGELTSLKKLSISGSSITKLPDVICNLQSLESLILIYNKLTELPQNIGNLTSLKGWVGLQHNNLKSLPQSIMNLNTTPYGVDVCWNDSLVFTPEQCAWYGVKDYRDYIAKYCASGIEQEPNKPISRVVMGNIASIHVLNATVVFTLQRPANVECRLYDSRGRIVESLISGYTEAGTHSIALGQKGCGSGVYYLSIRAGKEQRNKTVVLER
jgi:Leucine-rich repeat (LRR) protein